MEKLTLDDFRLIDSMNEEGTVWTQPHYEKVVRGSLAFARRVLEAQAKGGKMVSPECTDKMLSDGIDAYCDCETSNQGDIEQWKAMHAAAPDMLEE